LCSGGIAHNERVQGYGEDLAYIHDVGHSEYALSAAPGLLRMLAARAAPGGVIVDLGCGSGRWARKLNRAGYEVLGIDQSPAMIRMARKNAPDSEFLIGSLWSARLPPCDGITSLGECLNYSFDEKAGKGAVARLFRRAYRALTPGGVLVFDFAHPGRLPPGKTERRNWSEGRGWTVLTSVSGDREENVLCRRIVSFRKTGRCYRRSEETHWLRLYRPEAIAAELAQCGFRVRKLRGYGQFRFPRGISGMLAEKPRG
jgi:SAM-dependent methyltransferase